MGDGELSLAHDHPHNRRSPELPTIGLTDTNVRSRYPKRFDDNGVDVTVDLHGCSVADAVRIIRRTVQQASGRGRARVVVIHGRSGAGESAMRRTIKDELERMIGEGDLARWISHSTQDTAGGRTTLWMPIGPKRNATPIKVRDVVD